MEFRTGQAFLKALRKTKAGPVALVFCDDAVEIRSTVERHLELGFAAVAVLAPPGYPLPLPDSARILRAPWVAAGESAVQAALNAAIAACPGRWFFWGHNAEYLFYPFSETRKIGDLLSFHEGERRSAMPTTVVDLYPATLSAAPDGVTRLDAQFDRQGYVGEAVRERETAIRGGLRRRFERHVPRDQRRIDRIGLFRAERGLRIGPDFRLSIDEMNTDACPWHRNVTAAVASFRAAKALMGLPEARREIASFSWSGSETFHWSSGQFLEAGLMEAGQWF